MAFAILRTAKLTSIASIASSSEHNFRERETHNADPDRTRYNKTTGAQTTAQVLEAVKGRLATVPTVRKNGVLAIEYFIGASPEFFKLNKFNDKGKTYFDLAVKWLIDRHGKENVIAVTEQYDETTPHICAYVVPIDSRGRLNCANFLDGRAKLNQMQTEFAEKAGSPVGLIRGIEGSTAKHTSVKSFYAQIETPLPPTPQQPIEPEEVIDEPTKLERFSIAMGYDNAHSRALAKKAADRKRREAEHEESIRKQREAEHAKAMQYEAQRAAASAREARLLELRATAVQVRHLPLHDVLERLGCRRDKADAKNWFSPAGRITVDDTKFFAHDLSKGGGGAIDLVMLLENADYATAVSRLSQEFGSDAAESAAFAHVRPEIQAAIKAPQPYKAPVPVVENWQRVRQYLTVTRDLKPHLIDWLHERGRVYADKFSNAVFVLGKGIGVELRGTGEQPFHGTRGKKGTFALTRKVETRVAFVESPIDAISLFDLGFSGRVVSTGGHANFKELADKCRAEGLAIVAAFDNDSAGDKMAELLGEHERLKPIGKDWNEDLINMKAAKMTPLTDAEIVSNFNAIRRLNPEIHAPLEVTRAVDRILIRQAQARLKLAEEEKNAPSGPSM